MTPSLVQQAGTQDTMSNIYITGVSEPLTQASSDHPESCVLIESEAYNLLSEELRRYCTMQIHGRSFLISGHRGSGKTTIVQHALFNVQRRKHSAAGALRPLLVPLLGPSLIDDDADPAGEESKALETVLQQIILGIYRALAREITVSYRKRIMERGWITEDVGANGLEMAAALQRELDEYPELARLRLFWKRAEVLSTGVLFGGSAGRDADQGMREILALSTASQAYRRISGKFETKESSSDSSSLKSESSAGANTTLKDIVSLLLTLLTGGIVGTGLHATGVATGIPALFGGLLAAVVATGFFKFSWSRSREAATKRESLFIPDSTFRTLDRVLPVLLDRLRDAGLAPVFVIDELDKVDDLWLRMTHMISRLKKLVAETAFFCFLTDRSYFEQMRRQNSEKAYSVEYTYFTDQLFIVFDHERMLDYLTHVLGGPETELTAEDKDDLDVLPYILLHDAQMHAFDLRRKLCQLRAPGVESGNDLVFKVNLTTGIVRSYDDFRLKLLLQVTIAAQLKGARLQREINRDPSFRRLIYDAFYYITRKWEGYSMELHLDDEALFKAYLSDRMRTDSKRHGSHDASGPEPGENETKLLFGQVQTFAHLLAHPKALKDEINKCLPGLPKAVRDTLRLNDPDATDLQLLDLVPKHPHQYTWRFSPVGISLVDHPAHAAGFQRPWLGQCEAVLEAARILDRLSGGELTFSILAADLGILRTSPAWSAVEPAISRVLSINQSALSDDQKKDISVIADFLALVESSSALTGLALVCAHALARWAGTEGNAGRLRAALDIVSSEFDLRSKKPDQVHLVFTGLSSGLSVILPSMRGAAVIGFDHNQGPLQGGHSPYNLPGWEKAIRDCIEAVGRDPLPPDWIYAGLCASAWKLWEKRALEFLLRGAIALPEVDELACAIAGRPPGTFDSDLGNWTLRLWSLLFYNALNAHPEGDENYTPPGALPLALIALGFRPNFDDLASLASPKADSPPFTTSYEWQMIMPAYSSRRQGPAALIITQPGGSITESWMPAADDAALLLDPDEASKFFGPENNDLQFLRINYQVYELSADHLNVFKDIDSLVASLAPTRFPGSKLAFIVPAEYTLPFPAMDIPMVTDPASLEDLLDRIERGIRPESSPKPPRKPPRRKLRTIKK